MSLFEDHAYEWRETYFVLFAARHRPTAHAMDQALRRLGAFEIANVRGDESGMFESATVYSPADYAAMDISFVGAEDVLEQSEQLLEGIDADSLNAEEKGKLARIKTMDSRIDIYHFERLSSDSDDEDGCLDPTSLLIVMQAVVRLCGGVGVDPQSGSLV